MQYKQLFVGFEPHQPHTFSKVPKIGVFSKVVTPLLNQVFTPDFCHSLSKKILGLTVRNFRLFGVAIR
jgi:hypothetical protein